MSRREQETLRVKDRNRSGAAGKVGVKKTGKISVQDGSSAAMRSYFVHARLARGVNKRSQREMNQPFARGTSAHPPCASVYVGR